MDFKELLWATLAGSPSPKPTSLIIARHLTIMTNLITGQGVEFQPHEDPSGQRLSCLKKIVNQTGINGYLPDICIKTIGTGEVLIWLRLTRSGYRIRYYHYDEFVPYFYPDSDDLMAAIIRYSVQTEKGLKHYRVLVDSTGYYTAEDQNYQGTTSLVPNASGSWADLDESKYTFHSHPVPFFPLYLVRNKPTGAGTRAVHDFTGLEDDIVSNFKVYKAVSLNVKKFARQTILTNVPKDQLFKESGRTSLINLPSVRAGYKPIASSQVPEGPEIAEYIGVDGLAGETFVQPIDWNPINSDQITYLDKWSESIYESLASISKIGGNTAYETRAMIAVPLAAANRKSNLIFTEALCRMLSDCLIYESKLFKCPDALDRGIVWRRIELVEPSTRDQLDTSILTRNLSEQGVGDSELLKLQFPGRTEEDIKRLTGGSGGIPYRKIDKTVPAVQSLLDLASTVPDPEIQGRLYNLASNLVSSLETSLNYGKYPDPGYPDPGIEYPATNEPSPEPLGSPGQELGIPSPTGAVTSTPGASTPGPSNPLRDFFKSIWRGPRN